MCITWLSRTIFAGIALANAASFSPLFVTWNTISSLRKTPKLRGCIGTFEPQPLAEGLAEYAITSAIRDHRFHPIKEDELSKLECAVSLLTDFEECQDYLDWEIGTHGIYIYLENPAAQANGKPGGLSGLLNGSRSGRSSQQILTATYLPDVMPEQDWTKVEAIDSAIRKAGWNGKITEEIRKGLRVRRYKSERLPKTYKDYLAWKQGQGSR